MEATENLAPGEVLGRREKRKLETRERIEQAAYSLFKEFGIDDVSIEQICATADVARRTFYGHYPNKQALLQALSYNRVWFTADDLMHSLTRQHADTRSRLSAMIEYMEQTLADYSAIDRALILIAPGSLEEGNHLREVSDSLRDYIAQLIQEGQDAGDSTDSFSADILAEMVIGTTNSLIVNWALDPDYPITEKLEEARRLFESIISPD
jgi:AcrR family transcriptional regulator